jgi:hypothetical protein
MTRLPSSAILVYSAPTDRSAVANRYQPIFATFTKTDNVNDTSGPSEARYYSKEDGGVYYIYQQVLLLVVD